MDDHDSCDNKELNDCVNNKVILAYCPKLCGFCSYYEPLEEHCD